MDYLSILNALLLSITVTLTIIKFALNPEEKSNWEFEKTVKKFEDEIERCIEENLRDEFEDEPVNIRQFVFDGSTPFIFLISEIKRMVSLGTKREKISTEVLSIEDFVFLRKLSSDLTSETYLGKNYLNSTNY
ncbi:hypothetical protein MHBO_001333 [Bonamia ostreae]|uniref:Uncharacterized protein n=1 Tax=Bonamia ostreae TaxID=126728 RepID=A0ABV2AIM6_9EUKA